MRLLLVSDLHYRLRQLDWLAQAATDPNLALDAVVIAGDLLDIRSAVPLDVQAIAITAQLKSLGARTQVLVSSGNHDLDSRDDAGEKTARWLTRVHSAGVHVDGESVEISDVLFTVCKWWDGPHGQAELDAQLTTSQPPPGQTWAWVYHSPPTGSALSFDGRREFGDDALAAWIPRFEPDVILAGHIHQAPFVDGGGWAQRIGRTWIFNPGQQPGPVPTHVILDLEVGTAEWTSATERELVELFPAREPA
jgi:Icc-related predicted phosphoesterase